MQPEPIHAAPDTRLFFLDWLRIIAFFVLILFHVGMYYVSWGFHIKSPYASPTIEPLMMLTSPWRLSLLFMISGVASAFMLKKLAPRQFVRQRSHRLLLPLLFGMLVIVPPQSYLEAVEKAAYQGSYIEFMTFYLKAYQGFCDKDGCLILPTWNHLWFVMYLWVYTVLFGILMWALGERYELLAERCGRFLQGWKLMLVPIALLALARIGLIDHFAPTNNLIRDWYNHAQYFPLFLLGALVARQRNFWQALDAMRWPALGLALACWALIVVDMHWPAGKTMAFDKVFWRNVGDVLHAACQWAAIVAACGFAHRHLQFDSAKRRYLAQAVFPVYILHQTLFIIMAHAFKPALMPPLLEGVILVLLTLILSLAGFEAVHRVAWLRPLFGLARLDQAGAAASASTLPKVNLPT